MTKFHPFEIESIMYENYQNIYKSWRDHDKETKTNCLTDETHYTFCEDLCSFILCDDSLKYAEDYIKRMLKRFCKKTNPQAYYEMFISLITASNVFSAVEMDDLSEVCSNWYCNIAYYDYERYVNEEDWLKIMALR